MGYERRTASEREYLVYVPDRVGSEPTPAILFLHGMGESGSDIERVMGVGLGPAIDQAPDEWQFIVVMPQKLDATILWPSYRRLLNEILGQVETEFNVDPMRCYLTGLSQGGNGTWTLAKSLSWSFAAIAPVCGWADPKLVAQELGDTPVWAFHGEHDNAVPVQCSAACVECLRPHNPDVRLTLYPDLEHNCWDRAYGSEGLSQWFLQHSL